jgi:hypothetical protein
MIGVTVGNDPGQTAAGTGVVLRRHALGFIEAAAADVDLVAVAEAEG